MRLTKLDSHPILPIGGSQNYPPDVQQENGSWNASCMSRFFRTIWGLPRIRRRMLKDKNQVDYPPASLNKDFLWYSCFSCEWLYHILSLGNCDWYVFCVFTDMFFGFSLIWFYAIKISQARIPNGNRCSIFYVWAAPFHHCSDGCGNSGEILGRALGRVEI